MIQTVFIGFLVISIAVIAMVFWKKIPALTVMPEDKKNKKKGPISQLRKKIESSEALKNFSWNSVLLKMLSKIRILVLKIENKIGSCLQSLRIKSQNKKNH